NRSHAQRNMFGISEGILFDLHHQLSRRRHDQSAWPAFMPVVHRRRQLHQNRPNESRGFSGAGLRDANDIISRENVRDRRDLDRSWLGVAGVMNSLQDFRGKIKRTKWHRTTTVAR